MIFLYNNKETVTQWRRNRYCVCLRLYCSNRLRANVLMRIYFLRFYAAAIHTAASKACGVISPAKAEMPQNTDHSNRHSKCVRCEGFLKNIKTDPRTWCVQPCIKIPSLLKTINTLASVWLQAAKQDWKLCLTLKACSQKKRVTNRNNNGYLIL